MKSIAAKGTICVCGMTLEYRVFGRPLRLSPTIVMLHEGLGSVDTWGEFPRQLSEAIDTRVFIYSRAGYGASQPFGRGLSVDYIKYHALNVLPRILEGIGFRRGMLLGHSDGASMVAAYAGSVSDPRITGLVLMAPHFVVEPETLAEIRNAREAYTNRDLRRRLSRYHTNVDVAFWGWNNVWLEPAFAHFDLRDELAKIRVPMLIIRGNDDRYGTNRQIAIAKDICRCHLETLIIPNCGHIPHRREPELVLNAVTTFYRNLHSRLGTPRWA
jgi:pimeloyl-ACP methyl ester carboxylesterase